MLADPARCDQPDGEPGVRLFAGHSGRVGGSLGWPVAGRGAPSNPSGWRSAPSGLLSQLGPGHDPGGARRRLRGMARFAGI